MSLAAYALNLVDLFCTLYVLSLGVQEANSLMQSVPVMIFYKVVVVGGLLWWLSQRTEPLARVLLKVCTGAYAALALWHVWGLVMINK